MHELIWPVAGLVLFCAGAVTGWWGRGARDARRRYDVQIDGYQRVIAERQAGRHERTQPRAGSGQPGKSAGGAAGLQGPSRSFPPAPPRPREQAPRIASAQSKRLVTTADDIGPVIVPRGATTVPMRPQPPRTSGAGTQTMRALTDTGELRAIADQWAEKTRREQAVWAHEYAQRCETDRQEAGLNP